MTSAVLAGQGAPESLRWYFEHPGAWESVKQAIVDHPRSCASLEYVWTGHTGGVSGIGEQGPCDDCGVVFYNEGLMGAYAPGWTSGDPIEQNADGDDARLCDCCGALRRSRATRAGHSAAQAVSR